MLLFDDTKKEGYLLIASAFIGIALGTKVMTVLLLLPLIVVLIYFLFSSTPRMSRTRLVVWCVVIALCIGIIPYVIAYVKTGNPVFPYYNAIFKSPYIDTAVSFDQLRYKQGFDYKTLRDVTFSSGKYAEGGVGSFGWVFFVLLPISMVAAVHSKAKHSIVLIFISLSYIALVFSKQSYLRYIFPAVPLLIIVLTQGIESLRSKSKHLHTVTIVTGCFLIGLSVLFLQAQDWFYRDFNLKALWSISEREALQLKVAPIRRAVE
jgi:4-amino-4-deoxy-L-arabinose transferase-like glycosyltransferase